MTLDRTAMLAGTNPTSAPTIVVMTNAWMAAATGNGTANHG